MVLVLLIVLVPKVLLNLLLFTPESGFKAHEEPSDSLRLPDSQGERPSAAKEMGDSRYYSPFDKDTRSLAKVVLYSTARPTFKLLALELITLSLRTWTALLFATLY